MTDVKFLLVEVDVGGGPCQEWRQCGHSVRISCLTLVMMLVVTLEVELLLSLVMMVASGFLLFGDLAVRTLLVHPLD